VNAKEMMTTMVNTPSAWFRELHKLQDAGFTAAIAGGCLRDTDNGAPVKDVDIFVNPQPCSALMEFLGGGQSRFREYALALGWSENQATQYGSLEDVHGIWTYVADGVEYNVILLSKPQSLDSLARRMDFGICQIVSNACGVAWHTEAYAKDRAARTFTVTDADREARSVRRFARLQAKYPGWRLIAA
jgi:hypothetical protein